MQFATAPQKLYSHTKLRFAHAFSYFDFLVFGVVHPQLLQRTIVNVMFDLGFAIVKSQLARSFKEKLSACFLGPSEALWLVILAKVGTKRLDVLVELLNACRDLSNLAFGRVGGVCLASVTEKSHA